MTINLSIACLEWKYRQLLFIILKHWFSFTDVYCHLLECITLHLRENRRNQKSSCSSQMPTCFLVCLELGWVNWGELSFLWAFKGRFTQYNSFVCTYDKITTRVSLSPFRLLQHNSLYLFKYLFINSALKAQYICFIYQASGQDGGILAKFFFGMRRSWGQ